MARKHSLFVYFGVPPTKGRTPVGRAFDRLLVGVAGGLVGVMYITDHPAWPLWLAAFLFNTVHVRYRGRDD